MNYSQSQIKHYMDDQILSLINIYEPSECPLCKEGKIPVIKPGSRKIK